MGLILFEFMAKSGKSIEDLVKEVYDIVGFFAFERVDLHLTNELKNRQGTSGIEEKKNRRF